MNFSRSAFITIISGAFLLFFGAYALGAISHKFNIWPYSAFAEVWRFIAGHPEESTTLAQKILNDTGQTPTRFLFGRSKLAYPTSKYRRLTDLPLGDREPPLLYIGPDAATGYRLLYGTFLFDDKLHGAVLLDPNGDVQRIWRISEEGTDWEHAPDTNIRPHGLTVGRDGSILVAFIEGSTLTKYDYCGKIEWRIKSQYHHAMEFQDQETFWTWGRGRGLKNSDVPRNNRKDGVWKGYPEVWRQGRKNESIYEISYKDGEVLRDFSYQDLIDANPEIDIFSIRQEDNGEESLWADDPFHPNDVEPLSPLFAGHYSMFKAGDLLVSMRSLDLVFVLDPDTLKVEWWRMGQVRRQHDPDWNSQGTITIFNNNMNREASSIVEIDPTDMSSRVLVDGAKYDFYSKVGGKHSILPNDHIAISSSTQGRAFEVAPNGTVTFDFHNIYKAGTNSLLLDESKFLPLDYFREVPKCDE